MLRAAGAVLLLAAAMGPASRGAPEESLAAVRSRGDLAAQRAHLWGVLEAMTRPAPAGPAFESWAGEGEVFGPGGDPGMAGFRRPAGTGAGGGKGGAPVIAYSLYNPAAVDHIRRRGLQKAAVLEGLRDQGAGRAPDFPRDAIVAKTVWWPVAGDAVTALPVWDADLNPPSVYGNPYLGWSRMVAVDPKGVSGGTADVQLVGREAPRAPRFGLDAFHALAVDQGLARRLGADEEANRTALLVLGRPVAAGDHLVLVGLNVMTRELQDWVWGAFWWHDRPDAGAFAQGRPGALAGPWRRFLMQAAFDAETPRGADGGPHICFNPWLEGRFPDGGWGGGVKSNCVACHARASYPATPFLPVTRGPPDPAGDPALAHERLRTSFLWSLALHAQP